MWTVAGVSVPRSVSAIQQRFSSAWARFQEGDTVVLQRLDRISIEPTLSKPLQPGLRIPTHRGEFLHDDIIGKAPRDVLRSTRGTVARLTFPTLAEYVCLTPRLVTPIYPGEASLITSLLDIHPPLPGSDEHLEILEAGTGHGSLSLHLARAIHATNSTDSTQHSGSRAVVRSIDTSPRNSAHAASIVRGFHRGIYADNVEFHVGTVSSFLESRQAYPGVFSHAVLDLPNPHLQLGQLASALTHNGVVAVFVPNITQIVDCVKTIRENRLPLFMDQVVELGASVSGGRAWEVRAVRPRAWLRARAPVQEEEADAVAVEELGSSEDGEGAQQAVSEKLESIEEIDNEGWETVARPKFGKRVVAGGFLGLWKRIDLRN